MPFLSFLFYLAAAVLAVGSVAFYLVSGAVSCAYSSDPANCRTLLPWELDAGDLVLMILLPLGGTVVLALLGWLCETQKP